MDTWTHWHMGTLVGTWVHGNVSGWKHECKSHFYEWTKKPRPKKKKYEFKTEWNSVLMKIILHNKIIWVMWRKKKNNEEIKILQEKNKFSMKFFYFCLNFGGLSFETNIFGISNTIFFISTWLFQVVFNEYEILGVIKQWQYISKHKRTAWYEYVEKLHGHWVSTWVLFNNSPFEQRTQVFNIEWEKKMSF